MRVNTPPVEPGAYETALEADQELDFFDEGYAESLNTSYVTSIASDIRRGIEENGRTYPAYGKNQYGLPIDETEQDRNDLQHCKFGLILGDRLHLSPITAEPSHILDLGTGSGIWAIDMADKHENAEVLGVDLAPTQPTWVPPNCVFEIEDIENDWMFRFDHFDFIHARELLFSIRDWDKLIKQSYDHLKPGGYLELGASVPDAGCDDGTVPEDSAWLELTKVIIEIGEALGASILAPKTWQTRMEAAGFEDVHTAIYKVPTSPWPKDKRLKRIGALEVANLEKAADALILRGMTQVLGKSKEEAQILAAAAIHDSRNHRMHGYIHYYVTYGRRPVT